MEILSVEQLSKAYGDKELFNSISFSIEKQERIGLVGVNGTGKSTFLKVIAGVEDRDLGTINHAKDFSVAYLNQEPELIEDSTVLNEVFEGDAPIMIALRHYESVLDQLKKAPEDEKLQDNFTKAQAKMDELDAWEAEQTAKTILTKLGIEQFDQTIKSLSGGQKKRVALAKALIQPADLMILDEPTNHLDHETIEWLEKYLPTYPGAIILVTHDRYFLNRVTNRIFELDHGNLYRYIGNYETYLEKKSERLRQEKEQEQKHANTLKREIAWLKSGVKARSTKQKARIDRVEEMKEQSFQTKEESIDVGVSSKRLGKKVIELNQVQKAYQGEAIIPSFDFLIKPKDRIGIVGANGSGKTTLLNIISGYIKPDQGQVEVGPTVTFGYYTQDHSEMDEELRIIDYIRQTKEVMYTDSGERISAEKMLERFLFSRDKQWTYIKRLSGGEKRRLYLLKVLMEEPNVLLLDEPTNDLDTETLAILEDYLDQFPGVVITVSHDRYFLDRVTEQLIIFNQPGQIEKYFGNYSEWLKKQSETKPTKQKNQSTQEKPKRKRKKLSYNDQKEWNQIEDDISELELAIEQEQEKITAAGADVEAAQEHYQSVSELEQKLEAKMERWEELAILVEEAEQS
ncbi:ATP-binding cassette, subfamily F, uup [Pelagirhabdus alkalitolerans]|uniref:ATP-binding cassette, subfamily F, uup n=1 Tax=Pelagirhabdus alkalitolerans TaxID=1612202 RepID=A0A1G6GIK9_9BACI|nr:ABC-F family ATP-binding cassette domain-containing protein [Pelagirhabdus alkalitolerans]SDB81760.1 ATP-binding cassette, subfamily F, uup [Pelagirhabdus alkalitolerans]